MTNAITSLFQAIFDLFSGFIKAILHVFESVLRLIQTIVTDSAGLVKSSVAFVLDNIFILGFLAAAFIGYSIFVQQKGGVKPANRNLKKRA